MKTIISVMACVFFALAIFGTLPVSVFAAEPAVTWNIPAKLKIGDNPFKNSPAPEFIAGQGQNLSPVGAYFELDTDFHKAFFQPHLGDEPGIIASDGTAFAIIYASNVYKPGNYYVQARVGNKNIGERYAVTVEEPVITNNAPATIKVGSTLNFTTALTNTVLTNKKVSAFAEAITHDKDTNYNYVPDSSPDYMHMPAHRPVVEIIEGKNIVNQSNQDYTNTLSTSETLTFNKAGTVKVKVTYYQINTCSCIWYNFDYLGQGEPGMAKDNRYNPEKIITIHVTDPDAAPPSSASSTSSIPSSAPANSQASAPANSQASAPANSQASASEETVTFIPGDPIIITNTDTGVKLEADPGVVPPDTTVKVEIVTDGGNFIIINNALRQTSDKWNAFDISLIAEGVGIQPNGKVKITIPREIGFQGFSQNKMVLYHVAADGTLTEIPFTLDSARDNIIFETDHFSWYVIAERADAIDDVITDINHAKDNGGLWWPWLITGIVVLIGAGAAIWYFQFGKKLNES